MRPILSPQERPVLDAIARGSALLAFDFDGTLAPVVPDRNAAQLRPETHGLLRTLSLLYPCAVISGRARADVAARLAGIPLFAVVGNHGAEAGHGPVNRTRRLRLLAWKEILERALGGAPGIELEDKRHSVAVHYRHAPCRAAARHAVLKATSSLEGARVFGGRAVVNVIPEDAPDKATAIRELVSRLSSKLVVYAGDDRTDENVFGSADIDVGIRVGRTGRSLARYYVPAQAAVDDLLRALISARTRRDGLGERWQGLVQAVGR